MIMVYGREIDLDNLIPADNGTINILLPKTVVNTLIWFMHQSTPSNSPLRPIGFDSFRVDIFYLVQMRYTFLISDDIFFDI